MFYCTTTGQYINEGQAFSIDGTQYPANWLNLSTPEEKAAIGLEEVIATNQPFNPVYYWTGETLDGATLTFTGTPKELAGVQTDLVNQTNSAAYSILLPSDWMVVKSVETGTTINPAWNTWRQSIRQQAKDYVTAINACTTIEQLESLPAIQWEPSPDQQVK